MNFIKEKLTGKSTYEISSEDFENFFQKYEASKFQITELALFTTIDLIARNLAKCEFVTVENGKEVRKSEYHSWNYSPNKHQTKVGFIVEFISNLIFRNEAMIFETADGQRLVADRFSKTEYALYDDVFENVSARGWNFPRSYSASDVIYLKYNNFALNGLLTQMCKSYENLMKSAEQRYNKSVGHKGILKISNMATNTVDFQKQFKEVINERFKTYFNAQNAVLPLFDGYDYEPSTETSKSFNNEINDINKLKDAAVETVANAFHIPPAIINGTASQLSDATDAFIANAIDPLAQMLEQEITKKCYGEVGFLNGSYLLIDTTYVKHIDAISSANNIDKSIACGVLNPEKAQKYCHMLPSDSDYAQHYYMTKNYQTADLAVAERGGE